MCVTVKHYPTPTVCCLLSQTGKNTAPLITCCSFMGPWHCVWTRMWPTITFRFSAGLVLDSPRLVYATTQLHIPGSGLEPSRQDQISIPRIEFVLLTPRPCGSFENKALGARKGDIEDVCQAVVSWRGQCTRDLLRPSVFFLVALPSA